jgi:hypothetical protein
MSMKEKTLIQPVLSGGPSFSPNDRASLLEVLQRSRRIETRLTRLLETEGIQTGIQRPWWINDTVMVPSPTITLDAVLRCIPDNWFKPVPVVIKEDQTLIVMCHVQMPMPT